MMLPKKYAVMLGVAIAFLFVISIAGIILAFNDLTAVIATGG